MANTDDTSAPGLLKVSEVAAQLRVSEETCYRWIREGALPSIRLGNNPARGTIRIPARLLVNRLKRSASP